MKDTRHIATVLQCELDQWFIRQAVNPSTRYYIYYCPSSSPHNAGFSIHENKPANPEYVLAMSECINGYKTIQDNFNHIMPVLRTLPLLD